MIPNTDETGSEIRSCEGCVKALHTSACVWWGQEGAGPVRLAHGARGGVTVSIALKEQVNE